MSYQLEREMAYRVTRYHREAAVRRAVPRGQALRRLAIGLRSLADRLEQRAIAGSFASETPAVVLQGRKN